MNLLYSVSRKNSYMVSAGDLQQRYGSAGHEVTGKRASPGLVIGCFIDTATGVLSYSVNGKEVANKYQVWVLMLCHRLFLSVTVILQSKEIFWHFSGMDSSKMCKFVLLLFSFFFMSSKRRLFMASIFRCAYLKWYEDGCTLTYTASIFLMLWMALFLRGSKFVAIVFSFMTHTENRHFVGTGIRGWDPPRKPPKMVTNDN